MSACEHTRKMLLPYPEQVPEVPNFYRWRWICKNCGDPGEDLKFFDSPIEIEEYRQEVEEAGR